MPAGDVGALAVFCRLAVRDLGGLMAPRGIAMGRDRAATQINGRDREANPLPIPVTSPVKRRHGKPCGSGTGWRVDEKHLRARSLPGSDPDRAEKPSAHRVDAAPGIMQNARHGQGTFESEEFPDPVDMLVETTSQRVQGEPE